MSDTKTEKRTARLDAAGTAVGEWLRTTIVGKGIFATDVVESRLARKRELIRLLDRCLDPRRFKGRDLGAPEDILEVRDSLDAGPDDPDSDHVFTRIAQAYWRSLAADDE